MSIYRIFEPENQYDDNAFTTTLSAFARAAHNSDNVYYIQNNYNHYLIIEQNAKNLSLSYMFVHELTPKQFIDKLCTQLVDIQYENKDKDLIVVRMKIHELLDGFSCDGQRIPMILTSNSSTEQIDFYSSFSIVNPTHITETYKVGSVIPKYRALVIKNVLNESIGKMHDYIISQVIDKHSVTKRYGVRI